MSKGFLIFAHNNPEIDYTLIALCNALMIKYNLENNNVTLVTDKSSIEWLKTCKPQYIDKAFDNIIEVESIPMDKQGKRIFNDTLSTQKILPWHNKSRTSAYDLTPYDETIVIDADYLVVDNSFDQIWNVDSDVLINKKAKSLEHKPVAASDRYVGSYGIDMYWATCIYFTKSEKSRIFFDIMNHVKEYYKYYELLYNFNGKLYRNDFAASIAIHMLNGFRTTESYSFPHDTIFTSFDCDELIDIKRINELTFLVNDTKDRWRFQVSKIKNTSVHIMNKFSITRLADKIISIYGDV